MKHNYKQRVCCILSILRLLIIDQRCLSETWGDTQCSHIVVTLSACHILLELSNIISPSGHISLDDALTDLSPSCQFMKQSVVYIYVLHWMLWIPFHRMYYLMKLLFPWLNSCSRMRCALRRGTNWKIDSWWICLNTLKKERKREHKSAMFLAILFSQYVRPR